MILSWLFIFSLFSPSYSSNVVEDLKVKSDSSAEEQNKKLIATEVLVTQSENQALTHLKKLIQKYKGTSLEAGMRFRLAELYMDRAKSARFIEQISQDEGVRSFLPNIVKSLKERKWVEKAISEYASIEKDFPKYQDIDQVMFNKAFAYLQIEKDTQAEASFFKLLKTQKRSRLRPDAFLAVGEINFKNKRFSKALPYFNQVKKFKTSRVYPFGMYKAGWCHFNLDSYDEAVAGLESVIYFSREVKKKGLDQRLDLGAEAIMDMALFYSANRPAENALNYFTQLAGEHDPVPALQKLSGIYEKHGKDGSQQLILVGLIKRFPKSKQKPFFYKDLARNLDRQSKYDKAASSLWASYRSCVPLQKREENCMEQVRSLSKRLAVKWLKIYKENKKNPIMAAVSEDAFRVYLSDQVPHDDNSKMRHLFAEHLYDQKKFLESSSEYDKVGNSTKDKKLKHGSRYASIVAYDFANKSDYKTPETESRFRELTAKYMKDFSKGERYLDVAFKLGLYDYTKKNYDRAKPLLLSLGERFNAKKKGKKSQDLYLDILNFEKNYLGIQGYAKKWKSGEKDPKRSAGLQKILEQAFFSEVEILEKAEKYKEAVAKYDGFVKENGSSTYVDEARWNKIGLHFKLKEYGLTAESYVSFYQKHPKHKRAIPGLIKSVEIFEMMAEPEKAYSVSKLLSKVDLKDSARWSYLSATYLKSSGKYQTSAQEFLKIGSGKSEFKDMAMEEFFSLDKKLIMSSPWYKSEVYKLTGSPNSKAASKAVRVYAQSLYYSKNEPELKSFIAKFKNNSRILKDHRSLLYKYEGQMQEKPFFNFSISNATMNSIVSGIQNKTAALDKVQTSYQNALKDFDSHVVINSLVGLSRTYQGFVQNLKGVRSPAGFSKDETEALKGEIENLVMPFEEKAAESLDQALNLAKKDEIRDGSIQKIKVLYEKVNLEHKPYYPVALRIPSSIGPRGVKK